MLTFPIYDKGRRLSSFKGIDLSSKIRNEARDHERRELINPGFDVIQFLMNFFLYWKRFCCWFDLGDMNSPSVHQKRFNLIMDVISSELVVTVAL